MSSVTRSSTPADGSVGTAQLATGAVTEAKIGTGAVTVGKIGTGAVTNAKLGDNAVSKAKIGGDSVTTAQMDTDLVSNAGTVSAGSFTDFLGAIATRAFFLMAHVAGDVASSECHIGPQDVDAGAGRTAFRLKHTDGGGTDAVYDIDFLEVASS